MRSSRAVEIQLFYSTTSSMVELKSCQLKFSEILNREEEEICAFGMFWCRQSGKVQKFLKCAWMRAISLCEHCLTNDWCTWWIRWHSNRSGSNTRNSANDPGDALPVSSSPLELCSNVTGRMSKLVNIVDWDEMKALFYVNIKWISVEI